MGIFSSLSLYPGGRGCDLSPFHIAGPQLNQTKDGFCRTVCDLSLLPEPEATEERKDPKWPSWEGPMCLLVLPTSFTRNRGGTPNAPGSYASACVLEQSSFLELSASTGSARCFLSRTWGQGW